MRSRPLAFILMHALVATGASAQMPDRPERRPPPPAEMARQLGLDATKTPQFVQILEEQRSKMRALHDAREADRAAMRQQMDALHEETRTRLRTLLDADQLARFESLRPKPPGPPHDRDARNHAPPDARRQ